MQTGKIIELHVTESITALRVKELIRDNENIIVRKQRLIFDGNQLHNNSSLEIYKVQDESTLYLFPRVVSPGDYRIYVKTLIGQTITVMVFKSDTIDQIKQKISEDPEGM